MIHDDLLYEGYLSNIVYNYISLTIFHTHCTLVFWRKPQRCGIWEVKAVLRKRSTEAKDSEFLKRKKVCGFAGNI